MTGRVLFIGLLLITFYSNSYESNARKERREPDGKPWFHFLNTFRFLYFFKYKDQVLMQEWIMQLAMILLCAGCALCMVLKNFFRFDLFLLLDTLIWSDVILMLLCVAVLDCRYYYHLYFVNNSRHERDLLCTIKAGFGLRPRRKCKMITITGEYYDEYGESYRMGTVRCSKKIIIEHVFVYDDELIPGDITKVFLDDCYETTRWVIF